MVNFRKWTVRLLPILAVIGPGFITANVDNDAGGIFTYSQAGAQYGYSLLWTMIPITIALVVVQEMSARMGAVTGKGLSDLIREQFGFRMTFWLMIALIITNFGNVVAEFAGVASSLDLFGISRYLSVPVAAFVVWLLVVKGTYSSVEKIFLVASGFYVCYIIAGLLAHPDCSAASAGNDQPALGRRHSHLRILVHGDRARRHDDRTVDAVLPPGVDRRKRRDGQTISGLALGRGARLSLHRHRRLVHHRGVRGHAVRERPPRYQGRRRCGSGAASSRRTVCA